MKNTLNKLGLVSLLVFYGSLCNRGSPLKGSRSLRVFRRQVHPTFPMDIVIKPPGLMTLIRTRETRVYRLPEKSISGSQHTYTPKITSPGNLSLGFPVKHMNHVVIGEYWIKMKLLEGGY